MRPRLQLRCDHILSRLVEPRHRECSCGPRDFWFFANEWSLTIELLALVRTNRLLSQLLQAVFPLALDRLWVIWIFFGRERLFFYEFLFKRNSCIILVSAFVRLCQVLCRISANVLPSIPKRGKKSRGCSPAARSLVQSNHQWRILFVKRSTVTA